MRKIHIVLTGHHKGAVYALFTAYMLKQFELECELEVILFGCPHMFG